MKARSYIELGFYKAGRNKSLKRLDKSAKPAKIVSSTKEKNHG